MLLDLMFGWLSAVGTFAVAQSRVRPGVLIGLVLLLTQGQYAQATTEDLQAASPSWDDPDTDGG